MAQSETGATTVEHETEVVIINNEANEQPKECSAINVGETSMADKVKILNQALKKAFENQRILKEAVGKLSKQVRETRKHSKIENPLQKNKHQHHRNRRRSRSRGASRERNTRFGINIGSIDLTSSSSESSDGTQNQLQKLDLNATEKLAATRKTGEKGEVGDRHKSRHYDRSRSREQSRGRSRGRSRGHSRGHSRGRSRDHSREHSYTDIQRGIAATPAATNYVFGSEHIECCMLRNSIRKRQRSRQCSRSRSRSQSKTRDREILPIETEIQNTRSERQKSRHETQNLHSGNPPHFGLSNPFMMGRGDIRGFCNFTGPHHHHNHHGHHHFAPMMGRGAHLHFRTHHH